MFGINFIKFDSMTYVIKFKNGQVAKEGRGLSFFYYAPTTSISAVPIGSSNLPFIFNETNTRIMILIRIMPNKALAFFFLP